MRRKKMSFFEDVSNTDGIEAEPAWPELRVALREPANAEDLGLWRLAEDSARLARPRSTLVRLIPRTEPHPPDWPDAA